MKEKLTNEQSSAEFISSRPETGDAKYLVNRLTKNIFENVGNLKQRAYIRGEKLFSPDLEKAAKDIKVDVIDRAIDMIKAKEAKNLKSAFKLITQYGEFSQKTSNDILCEEFALTQARKTRELLEKNDYDKALKFILEINPRYEDRKIEKKATEFTNKFLKTLIKAKIVEQDLQMNAEGLREALLLAKKANLLTGDEVFKLLEKDRKSLAKKTKTLKVPKAEEKKQKIEEEKLSQLPPKTLSKTMPLKETIKTLSVEDLIELKKEARRLREAIFGKEDKRKSVFEEEDMNFPKQDFSKHFTGKDNSSTDRNPEDAHYTGEQKRIAEEHIVDDYEKEIEEYNEMVDGAAGRYYGTEKREDD